MARETVIELESPEIEVRFRVLAQARRFTLRLDRDGSGAILTLPPGVPVCEARMFLMRQSDWLARAIEQHPGHIPVDIGTMLPVAGADVEIVARVGPRRAPRLDGGALVLSGGGAPGPRIAAWLKMQARDALAPAVARYAAKLGRRAGAISLRDTRSRWGSCTNRGRLSFSWRLAMAPPEVLDYVAAHEVVHLAEMSHAPRYWAALEAILPGYREPRAWLKREGRRLHAYQFNG